MKRSAWALAAVLLAIMLGTAALFILNGQREPVLQNGVFCSIQGQGEYMLTGWEPVGDAWNFELTLSQPADLSLALSRSRPFVLELNGNLIYTCAEDSAYRRMHFADLGMCEGTISLSFLDTAAEANTSALFVFLGSSAWMHAKEDIITYLSYFMFGLLALVFFYSATLYSRKRSETYLLLLSVLALLLIVDMPLTPFSIAVHEGFKLYGLILIYMIRVWICLVLLDVSLPTIVRRMLSWKSFCLVYAVSVLFGIITQGFSLVLRGLVLLTGIYIVICGCAQRRRNAGSLLVGFALTQGAQLFMSATELFNLPCSVMFYSLRVSKAIDIPFMLSIILAINFRFSEKFFDAENLVIRLDEANASLDAKVREATAQLVKEQAQKHNMMLNIFHDLRSPIFIMEGGLDMMSSDTDSIKEAIPLLQDRLRFLRQLTEDLFLIAKFEDDKVYFAADPVNFTHVAEHVIDGITVLAEQKRISVCSEIEPHCLVWGDEKRLEQMLQNLIVNAIYYTPVSGRVSVSLRVDNTELILSVADTGKGIAQENIPHVFQRYYAVEQSGASIKGAESTGLGLSIAYEIAKHHKGNITLQSTVGAGSRFTVTLPLWNPIKKQNETNP